MCQHYCTHLATRLDGGFELGKHLVLLANLLLILLVFGFKKRKKKKISLENQRNKQPEKKHKHTVEFAACSFLFAQVIVLSQKLIDFVVEHFHVLLFNFRELLGLIGYLVLYKFRNTGIDRIFSVV